MPRAAIVVATLALLTALAAGAIAIGSSSGPTLPAPFGPAGNGLIAFVSGGELHVVDPDEGDPRLIPTAPGRVTDPTWSRNGTLLAYWVGPDGEAADLVVTDLDGGDPVVVATSLGPHYDRIEWSADGAEVMYSEIVPGLAAGPCPGLGSACGSRLFVASVDGSGSEQVGDPDLDARGPALSPDGTVAFGGGDGAVEALYVMQWDGSEVRRLETELPSGIWGFVQQSWHPDGRTIATKPGGSGIWIVELDGSGMVVATEPLGDGIWPSYSPDGSAVEASGSPAQLRLIWPDDVGEPVRVIGVDGGAAWAPDGTRLVGIRGDDLIVYGRDGEVIDELGAADGETPSWQRVAP